MIKPRLRLYVCASAVVVTLGGAVLTQAAGPGEFISRLWKREPAPKKEVTSGFSPFKWMRRDKSDSSTGRVEISDRGRRVVSERPQLVTDPFLTESAPTAPNVHQVEKPVSKGVIVRPQPRRKPATTQTVDLNPPAASQRPHPPSGGVGRTRITDFGQSSSQNRAASVAQQSLPEVQKARAPQPSKGQSPRNGQFVSGFDSEFQKLFKEVIEESRQTKGSTSTPRLPDEATANAPSPGVARLPDTETPPADSLRKDFARFAQERTGPEVDNLIRESRNQMESSVLARQASRDRGTTNVAGTSHSSPNPTPSTSGSPVDSNAAGSAFTPQRLPDRVPQTVNQLIVPSSMVPDRRLFTTSEGWMNRGELERQAAAAAVPGPDLQPVVRVVPGDRGAGVVIESGQWAPIQPRVSSNVAPARSVPDTSQFRRLSFEGDDASAETGAVQAIGDGLKQQSNPSTNAPHAGQHSGHSAFMIPPMSEESPTVPPALAVEAEPGEEMIMIIPANRTDHSLDAAEVAAALASVPEPPKTSQAAFEWPDESEIAVAPADGGFPWKTTVFFLALTGTAIGLFFRRKAQGGIFVTTGTSTES